MHTPPFAPLVKRALRGRRHAPARARLAKQLASFQFDLLDFDVDPACVCGVARRWQCIACLDAFCVPCPHACDAPRGSVVCGEMAQLRAVGSPRIPRGPDPWHVRALDWLERMWSTLRGTP